MKGIIFLLILLPSLISAQTVTGSTILDLKNQINIDSKNLSYDQEDFLIPQKKKTGLAILYSLLLPGMGELYAENYNSGMYFTIADGVLWGTLAGFNIYGNWQRDNYRAFAESHGNINLNEKTDTFFATIGDYLDVDEYNRIQELYRNFDEVYNTETHYWKWENNDQRREYRGMWTSSENAFNNIRFIVGGLILNRLISAINAARLTVAYNKKIEEKVSWNVSVDVVTHYDQPVLRFNFATSF
ncbi:MAG: hypothetical protein A2V66_13410 [Ignavibacteria bacterium RBG_13_36_8]|nr:MAG: hypothetical protein A2V66_13410 [Ignavibacteria bacterium RBG_13_36_8]